MHIIVGLINEPSSGDVELLPLPQMEQAVAEVEVRQVREIVEAGLSSYSAVRTSPQAAVARRVRARHRKK